MSEKRKPLSTAIILAGGVGKRMNSSIPKQYILINDKPLLYYTLKAFELSKVSNVVLVAGKEDMEYCRKEIIEKYDIKKISAIVAGGEERYDSVNNGLKVTDGEYILIHDGARPCISVTLINDALQYVIENETCVVGVPVKDTIKVVTNRKIDQTPDRSLLWSIQTPQCFRATLIKEAYNRLYQGCRNGITDDAMVVEQMMQIKANVMMGAYENLKVTTPEDLKIAELFLEHREYY